MIIKNEILLISYSLVVYHVEMISLTLLVAIFTNLILLPAIYLSIDKRRSKREARDTPFTEIESSKD